jgi:hypothetical protein
MKSKTLKKPGEKAPKGFTPELYSALEGDLFDEDDISSTGTISSRDEEEDLDEPVTPVIIPKRKVVPVVHLLQEEMDYR